MRLWRAHTSANQQRAQHSGSRAFQASQSHSAPNTIRCLEVEHQVLLVIIIIPSVTYFVILRTDCGHICIALAISFQSPDNAWVFGLFFPMLRINLHFCYHLYDRHASCQQLLVRQTVQRGTCKIPASKKIPLPWSGSWKNLHTTKTDSVLPNAIAMPVKLLRGQELLPCTPTMANTFFYLLTLLESLEMT